MTEFKPAKSNLITPDGYKKMLDEARQLWEVERPRIVDEVQQAAAQGDRSENAEYIYGKRRLREIDRRYRFLQTRMGIAKIVDPKLQKKDRVDFGATVEVETEDGEVRTYQIVGEDETEPSLRRISWKSPVGKALMNKRVDDYVEIETPKGFIGLTILKFEYR